MQTQPSNHENKYITDTVGPYQPNLQILRRATPNVSIGSGIYNSKCERKLKLIGIFNHSF